MALEELSFEIVNGRTDNRTDGQTDGRTDDGQKVITIAHPEHSSNVPDKAQLSLGSAQKDINQTQLCFILGSSARFEISFFFNTPH